VIAAPRNVSGRWPRLPRPGVSGGTGAGHLVELLDYATIGAHPKVFTGALTGGYTGRTHPVLRYVEDLVRP
jgi:hypothetical protein